MYAKLLLNSNRQGVLERFPVRHAYSLRESGNMSDRYESRPGEAAGNRKRFLDGVGFGGYRKVRMIPQHGLEIVAVDSSDDGKEISCDGLITTDPNVALTACVADCYPVIITPLSRDVLMMLHIGVNGAAEGMVERALALIREKYSIAPDRLLVGMGPGICVRCYDAQWIVEQYGKLEAWKNFLLLDERDGKQHCDLRGYVAHGFRKLGVQENNLFIAQECTCCGRYPTGEFLLDSHHRAKTQGREERFLIAAAMA